MNVSAIEHEHIDLHIDTRAYSLRSDSSRRRAAARGRSPEKQLSYTQLCAGRRPAGKSEGSRSYVEECICGSDSTDISLSQNRQGTHSIEEVRTELIARETCKNSQEWSTKGFPHWRVILQNLHSNNRAS